MLNPSLPALTVAEIKSGYLCSLFVAVLDMAQDECDNDTLNLLLMACDLNAEIHRILRILTDEADEREAHHG